MAGKRNFLLLLQLFCWTVDGSWAQRSPFSLQAAVDELHRREASKYPLNSPPSQQQPHYFAGVSEPDYWDEGSSDFPANTNNNNNNNNKNHNRHRLNKALAKYLERENYDADHGGLSLGPFGGYEFDEDGNNFLPPNYSEEKKRSSSFFRERDNNYENAPATQFRERESNPSIQPSEHAELTEQFLRGIEETQEHDREERYKEALRHLWEKYQQQENEIEGDLFEENKKKRMRTPPYYMLMQKKRSSYPVLPWLPDRKKRFPVAKRSTKRSPVDNNNLSGKTDEKVARELSELFGVSNDDKKKKRSTDDQSQLVASTHVPPDNTASTAMSDMRLEIPTKKENATEAATKTAPAVEEHGHQHGGHAGHQGHSQKEHKHRKRSDHRHHSSHEGSHEEPEESEEHEHGESEHEEEEEDEDEHEDFEEDEEEERKKKREVGAGVIKGTNGEVFKADQVLPGDFSNFRRKKSIQWSKYFGLDRKKKALKRDNRPELDVKKRSAATEEDSEIDAEIEKKRRDLDPEKLENMDKKLQSIEDFIIDETIKYTGAHEGIANPDEIRRLKDHVLSRLATAYSLEKMRRALEKLRQSVENENHLLRNVIESSDSRRSNNDDESLENQKRLSVKKEKAPLHDNLHLSSTNEKSKELHSNAMMSTAPAAGNAHNKNSADSDSDDNDEEDMRKKKKRNNGYLRYPELPNDFTDLDEEFGGGYEALNDAYLGNKNYIVGSNQCPLLEVMAQRCRGVDLLSGDVNQELLPICGAHQICYLCGTSQVGCDYQYLSDADSICDNNNDCKAAARSVLMILRGTPGQQFGPRECFKNSCLYNAMREIGL